MPILPPSSYSHQRPTKNSLRLKALKSLRFKDIDIHGTQLVYHEQTSSVERLFWALILLAGFTVCIIMCCVTVYGFGGAPTTTIISRVNNKSLAMPDIAICSSYPWNIPKMMENNFSMDLIYDLIDSYLIADPDPVFFPNVPKDVSISEKKEKLRAAVPGGQMDHLFLEYGLRCEDSLLSCNFGTFQFDCCPRHNKYKDRNVSTAFTSSEGDWQPPENCMARPFLHPKLGTCMVMREIPNQRSLHQRAGLTMILRMDPNLHAMEKYSVGYPYEAFLLEFSLDYFFSTNDVTLASLGMVTNIQLSATQTIRKASGIFKEKCDETNHRGRRSDSCTSYCTSAAITKFCHCEEHGFLDDKTGPRLCSPIEEVTCPKQYRRQIQEDSYACELEYCARKPCNEWSYRVTTSVGRLTMDVFDLLGNETDIKLEELAMISVRHSSLV